MSKRAKLRQIRFYGIREFDIFIYFYSKKLYERWRKKELTHEETEHDEKQLLGLDSQSL